MHMADALLSPAVAVTMYAASAAAAGVSLVQLRREELAASETAKKKLPTMAVMSALVFAGQMINYTIPGTGSSGHLCGGMLLSAMLGPWAGFLSMIVILAIQALFFADGGLLALGANVWNMAFYGCFVGYFLIYRPLMRGNLSAGKARLRLTLASVLGCVATLQLGAFSVVLETTLSGITALPLGAFAVLMQPIHLAIGLVEGLITAAELPLFDGLGLSFPDIVIGSRILGGETPKTKAMRENPDIDYETEFAKLGRVSETLAALCRASVRVRIINDGPMAAFSAAAELAADGAELTRGVVAYAMGTDLGSGWIDARGDIPEIPLELYDLLLDLGSAPWKHIPPEDIRSVRNENSGLSGVRRYLGQAATYRLAQELQPSLLDGLTEETDGIIRIKAAPQDMRKPALERLMTAAADGNGAAREIFRRIGLNLAALTEEMEYLLSTGTDSRYIFGRFAKIPGCFALIREGFGSVLPDMKLIAADDGLARSGLMRQLARLDGVTVAQFAQAVSAIYYSCMN